MTPKEEAQRILNIYRMMQIDGSIYLEEDSEKIDTLYEAVVDAINDCGLLKPTLPYNEFVLPCRKVREGDRGWIGHFEEWDNRRFFMSDVYDYLVLLYGRG